MRTLAAAITLALASTTGMANSVEDEDTIMLAGLDVGIQADVQADVNTKATTDASINALRSTSRAAARSSKQMEARSHSKVEAQTGGMSDSFARLDADADGHITAEEAHVNPQFERVFGAIDSDDNGVVTAVEFRAYTGGNS